MLSQPVYIFPNIWQPVVSFLLDIEIHVYGINIILLNVLFFEIF